VTNYRAGRGVLADANLVYIILIFFNVTTTSLIGILWSGESVISRAEQTELKYLWGWGGGGGGGKLKMKNNKKKIYMLFYKNNSRNFYDFSYSRNNITVIFSICFIIKAYPF
jgi:hypothetical protein